MTALRLASWASFIPTKTPLSRGQRFSPQLSKRESPGGRRERVVPQQRHARKLC